MDGGGYVVWLSTPSASDIDGKDCRVVCLMFSLSSALVRLDSGGVWMPDLIDVHPFAGAGVA